MSGILVAVIVCRHQAFVPAGVQSVWELVGDPSRHPEWWPEVVEVQGSRFGRGCEYCQVSRGADGLNEDIFTIERIEEFRELLVRCAESGLFMRWLLTEAQDGTFIDAEFGVEPEIGADAGPPIDQDATRDQLRRWLQASLDGLSDASAPAA